MHDNQIEVVPQCLEGLTELMNLDLSDNLIKRIPDFFGSFANLQYLHLNNNTISVLPESIGELRNLNWLMVNDNQITTVPSCISFANLGQLSKFELKNNRIAAFSEDFPIWPSEVLILEGNPVMDIPDPNWVKIDSL